jgi:RNA polymerase II subunit A small phosphatase-like protein
VISHRLYRHHTVHLQNNFTHQIHYVKDLTRIGRPLESTIIIDNLKENFCWQKKNGINIKTWTNDEQDNELQQLIPLLASIVKEGHKDVRNALVEFRKRREMGSIFPSVDNSVSC